MPSNSNGAGLRGGVPWCKVLKVTSLSLDKLGLVMTGVYIYIKYIHDPSIYPSSHLSINLSAHPIQSNPPVSTMVNTDLNIHQWRFLWTYIYIIICGYAIWNIMYDAEDCDDEWSLSGLEGILFSNKLVRGLLWGRTDDWSPWLIWLTSTDHWLWNLYVTWVTWLQT